MEARNHQNRTSHENAVFCDAGLPRISRVEPSAWRLTSSRSSHSIQIQDTETMYNAKKFQKQVDNRYTTGPVRPTTMTKGLSEVTNRIECQITESSFNERIPDSYRYYESRPQQLPICAYSERFQSLPKSCLERNQKSRVRRALSGPSNYGVPFWRDQGNAKQIQLRHCVQSAQRHFLRRKQRIFSNIPNPYLQTSIKSPSRNFVQTALESLSSETNDAFEIKASIVASSPSHHVNTQGTYHKKSKGMILSENSPSRCLNTNILKITDGKIPHKRDYSSMFYKEKYDLQEKNAKKSRSRMLDILCTATLELGPIQANPSTGCSCPRSNCIKLYCDCFKAGRHCSGQCSCINCKNTAEETRVDGERIRAIKNTLARNPRAFTGGKKEAIPLNPGDIVCNCLKSRCLKLYCHCFHKGRTCNEACLCVGCLNTNEESSVGGKRNLAIQNCLEKRPDAFTKKPKEVGSGCACKNNKCLKKYCDCFRFELKCSEKCSCKNCGNGKVVGV